MHLRLELLAYTSLITVVYLMLYFGLSFAESTVINCQAATS